MFFTWLPSNYNFKYLIPDNNTTKIDLYSTQSGFSMKINGRDKILFSTEMKYSLM